jgi:hypothetical protein
MGKLLQGISITLNLLQPISIACLRDRNNMKSSFSYLFWQFISQPAEYKHAASQQRV